MQKGTNVGWMLTVVFMAAVRCGLGEAYHGYNLNPEYRYDILGRTNTGFRFDPNNLPAVGKTTLRDLDRIYPGGPEFRWSFRPPLTKGIGGQNVTVDRIVQYSYYRVQGTETDDPNGMHSTMRWPLERIHLDVFASEGAVVAFYIVHVVNSTGAPSGKMVPGKWNTATTITKYGTPSWPGHDADLATYWKQRGDASRHNAYALSPFEKEEKWTKAADPTPEEAEAFHRQFKYQIWR